MASPPLFGDSDFQQAMQRLLPPGRAWRVDTTSNLSALLLALAPTYTRSTAAAAQVLVDADPDTTVNLLDEWEESLGLPDPCTPLNPSLTQRQAAVRAKWGGRGGLNTGYFIALAANLGFTITITEFRPFAADMACDGPDYDPAWGSAWQVNAPQVTTLYFSAYQSNADDPLETYDSAELICRLVTNAPAETTVIFQFT